MRSGTATGLGLKKGTWTAHEDALLKICIEKYGEGKWHLIPFKAGLNRCRKSCRLRWLNYLRPNIKREKFGAGEVDLILRLHKLLGNRWSLIAGRIPGRTANDVKNYWNSHLRSRSELKKRVSFKHITTTLIKPKPRTISKTLNMIMDNNPQISAHRGSSPIKSSVDDTINEHLVDLFDDREKEVDKFGWSFGDFQVAGGNFNVGEKEDEYFNHLSGYPMDEFVWDLMDSNQI